jgi:hypothetical protein
LNSNRITVYINGTTGFEQPQSWGWLRLATGH